MKQDEREFQENQDFSTQLKFYRAHLEKLELSEENYETKLQEYTVYLENL